MAGRYNKWLRARLADRIEQNGGYSSRYGSSALSWTVRYFGVITDVEEAEKALVEHRHFISAADLAIQFPDFEEWFDEIDQSQMWGDVRDQLQECLADDDGMRMWSPDTAARYGFDYKGDGADRPFPATILEGRGGGGKHVCLTQFCGEALGMSSGDLADIIRMHEHPDGYTRDLSNEWCRQLMGFMDELDVTLTDENAETCGQYYEADWLARELGLFD